MLIPEEDVLRKARLKKLIISVIIGSIAVHLIAGIIAAIWVVARYFTPVPATFEVRKDLRIPPKEREHKMNMAEFDALTPKPAFQEKLASIRPADFALPDLPKVPFNQMMPLDPTEMVSDQVTSLVGAAGAGGGGEGGGGLGGKGEGFSFFGVESSARRVLLIFDVSGSVINKAKKAGITTASLKKETMDLINKFGINTRFGIIQMTQNYKPFLGELVPATEQNKVAAQQWVTEQWTEAGTISGAGVTSNPQGLVGVLEFAYKLDPDVIFIVSDASFQWRPEGKISNIPFKELRGILKADEEKRGSRIPVHLIGFEMKTDDRNEWRRLSRSTGGNVRELK